MGFFNEEGYTPHFPTQPGWGEDVQSRPKGAPEDEAETLEVNASNPWATGGPHVGEMPHLTGSLAVGNVEIDAVTEAELPEYQPEYSGE